MAIIPTVRCRSMRESVAFYTGILDFVRSDGDDDPGECSFVELARDGDRLILASDDGVFGTVMVVTTDDIDGLLREFYVEDPDGNTLRFTQVAGPHGESGQ